MTHLTKAGTYKQCCWFPQQHQVISQMISHENELISCMQYALWYHNLHGVTWSPPKLYARKHLIGLFKWVPLFFMWWLKWCYYIAAYKWFGVLVPECWYDKSWCPHYKQLLRSYRISHYFKGIYFTSSMYKYLFVGSKGQSCILIISKIRLIKMMKGKYLKFLNELS